MENKTCLYALILTCIVLTGCTIGAFVLCVEKNEVVIAQQEELKATDLEIARVIYRFILTEYSEHTHRYSDGKIMVDEKERGE